MYTVSSGNYTENVWIITCLKMLNIWDVKCLKGLNSTLLELASKAITIWFKMYFIKFVGIDDSLHTDHIYFPLIPCEILQEIFQRLKKQKVQACGISIFCFFSLPCI